MTIKPTNSNQCDLPMTPDHITFYNWDTSNYDHYRADILTESQINELKDKYKSIDNNKELASDFSPMSHDLDEYYDELAEEFEELAANES